MPLTTKASFTRSQTRERFLGAGSGRARFREVLDFGISKMKAARNALTSASAVMGTPNYTSPSRPPAND